MRKTTDNQKTPGKTRRMMPMSEYAKEQGAISRTVIFKCRMSNKAAKEARRGNRNPKK